jgi:Ca2+-binding EF-hand superfamily protein
MQEGNNLSMIKRTALAIIDSLKEQIMTDCNEEELQEAMTKFHPQSNGYVKREEFVNYDEALKILGLQNNRTKLNKLCKEHGIKNQKINNVCVGFLRKEIERLAKIIKSK